MAAPTYGAAGTYRQGSSATPAFAAPASVGATSIVIIDMYMDPTTISSLPSGFAHAPGSPVSVNIGGGGEHMLVRLWARNPAGSSYTVTLGASVYSNGCAHRVDGCVSSGDPWDTNSGTGTAVAVATDITSGTTPAVSMTTQVNDQLLWFSGTNWGGGNWTPPSAGGTWTERLDTGDKTLTVDTLAQATAGATGSVTATCATADRRAGLLGSLLSVAAGGGSVSGTAAAALGGATSTAAGTPTVLGTAAKNLGGLSATASGTPTVSGSAAAALGRATATAAGTPTVLGAAAAGLGALTGTATVGAAAITGTAAALLGRLTASAAGTPTVLGAGAAQLGRPAGTSAGLPTVFGAATAPLHGMSAAAAGRRSTSGAAAAALGALTASTAPAALGTRLAGEMHGPQLQSPGLVDHQSIAISGSAGG